MNMVIGIMFVWLGCVSIYIAVHGRELNFGSAVTKPWEAYMGLMNKIKTS